MNKKLRLVVTDCCHNQCPLCCNKRYDMTQLPVVDRWDYDEVMITGGEPSLFSNRVRELVESIRILDAASGKSRKIYMYTAVYSSTFVAYLLDCLDGIVASPHNQRDVVQFVELVKQIEWGKHVDIKIILTSLSALTSSQKLRSSFLLTSTSQNGKSKTQNGLMIAQFLTVRTYAEQTNCLCKL